MKKPFYKKWWFWGIIIFFILGIAGTHDKKEKEKKNAVKEVTAENKQEVKKEESLDKINYDNLPRENLPIIAKQYWMHPGFKEK